MRFTKLRIAGFKSFVDPTEFAIEPGITGVVGPNGCGKSNIVEALRWVMGENRAKNMRSSAMDDVIFNGTAQRPARNLAEVTLFLDNSTRSAPAAFNDSDELQISRQIERERGSTYRINGKEVRARDVQLLFADAASGAHSTAIVSQGQIGALINARPTDRRLILEEAAGITGLHSRRHEAELRLRGAEQNLERLDDVAVTVEGQLESMKRQARQANRYRRIGGQIRRFEAIRLHLRYTAAEAAVAGAETQFAAAEREVAAATTMVANANTQANNASETLPDLRQQEAEAAAKLHRLAVARDGLEKEQQRLQQAQQAVQQRRQQINEDIARQQTLIADSEAAEARLQQECQGLQQAQSARHEKRAASQSQHDAQKEKVAALETELEAVTTQLSQETARIAALERQIQDTASRLARLQQRRERQQADLQQVEAAIADDESVRRAKATVEQSEADLATATEAEETADAARSDAEATAQQQLEALRAVESEETRAKAEIDALSDLLAAHSKDLFPPLVDAISVEPGYEQALGAALGDDLEIPLDEAASAHWASRPLTLLSASAPSLPAAAEPLSNRVQAPPALQARLSQIGVIDAQDAATALGQMAQGQRLVTKSGALWRWDGLTVSDSAETSAATRLRQRNRLEEISSRRTALLAQLEGLRAAYQQADGVKNAAIQRQSECRNARRAADERAREARRAAAKAIEADAARASERQALNDSLQQLAGDIAEVEQTKQSAEQERATIPPLDPQRDRANGLRLALGEQRGQLADLRAAVEQLRHEQHLAEQRLGAIAEESQAWAQRLDQATSQQANLQSRLQAAVAEAEALAQEPARLKQQRDLLLEQIGQAEEERQVAADQLAEAEALAETAQKHLKTAEQSLAGCREERVRCEAAVGQCHERLQAVEAQVREILECAPSEVLAQAEIAADETLPALEQAETRLERLKRERENLGAVNLRAEQEARELEEQLTTMQTERADLEAAIARLRQAISNLNREGRSRLTRAFEQVDGRFQDLFARLFGGGKANLALTGADDPLECGLEIMASPPGKKMQNLSLLSGGEQALTALALMFAVFQTNPAPICILDEVDAPLDDANVHRFCDLVEDIAKDTKTRFVVVTHHEYSMARMHRLFGVTMAERGISQLVSVDLQRATEMRAAG